MQVSRNNVIAKRNTLLTLVMTEVLKTKGEKIYVKKERIVSICMCISMALLLISSYITIAVLRHQRDVLIDFVK